MDAAIVTTHADHEIAGLAQGQGAWAGIIGAWLAEVQRRTGSERTPVEYGRYAARFAEFLRGHGRSLDQATPADAHAFAYAALPDRRRDGAPGRQPGPASVNVRLAAIRSLYDFAERIGAVQMNPTDRVKRPQLPSVVAKGLTPEQCRMLLDAFPDTPGGRRDRTIAYLAMMTGLRRTELIELTAGALTMDDGVPMYQARTKGGKVRYYELPRPAYDAIVAYLDAAGTPLDRMPSDARIFPISSQTLYENLRRAGKQIGVEKLTVHTLRHTAAKLRRQAGASLEDVQALLGHSNVATTARYLARLEGSRDPGWAAAAALLQTPDSGRGR